MKIIYEDKDIIIVEKPAGQLVQSGKSFEMDLTSEIQNYRRRKGEEAYAAVINRLDRGVSGVVLFAKNKKTAAMLSQMMREREFCKQYYAIVCGKPEEKKGTFVDYLKKDAKNNVSFVADKSDKDAKRAELNYEVISTLEDEQGACYSLVKINLITGRHHQIRVQFSSRNLALVGDTKYTGELKEQETYVRERFGIKRGQIALCASVLKIKDKEYSVVPAWKSYFNISIS